MLWLIIVIFLILACWVFLILPDGSSPAQRAPFAKRAYAHRGLYAADQSVPENSLPAFRLAVENGYGAELDVQMTKDGRVVVLHDDDLKRACGRDEGVWEYTYEELLTFPLFGTRERIPLFSEVLEIFGGRQPLIVELKSAAPNVRELCEAVRLMLAEYPGDACVESFDPDVVRFFRRNDPDRLRGQLASLPEGKHPGWKEWCRSRLLFNWSSRPQFVAYGVGPKPLSVRLCEKLGAMKVCWTAREPDLHGRRMAENDAVIFEHYRPDPNP